MRTAPTTSSRGTAARAADAAVPSTPFAVATALVSVALVAAVLRPAVTSLGPVAWRIDEEFGLGATAIGVLGALPVLCFALVSAGVHAPAKRFGASRTVLAALIVLAAGLALRFAPGVAPLWVGTALVGIGIAVGNVLLPSLAKHWFPRRVSLVSGLYSGVMGTCAAIGSGLAVPIADAAGGEWRFALGASLPVVLVGIIWWSIRITRESAASRAAESGSAPEPARAVDSPRASADAADAAAARAVAATAPAPGARVWSSFTAWCVTGFMGLQSFGFYITVTWLPAIEQDAGISETASGWHLSLTQLAGVIAAVVCTAIMGHWRDQRYIAPIPTLFVLTGAIGYLVSPGEGTAIWALVLGAGQGAALAGALALIALRTATPLDTSKMSGMAQSVGYALAAVGPFIAGGLHDLTGSWTPVLSLLIGAAILQGLSAFGAGRDVTIGAGSR